jgi:hypothetical protein
VHPIAPHSTHDLNRFVLWAVHSATDADACRDQFAGFHPALQQHCLDRLRELSTSATTRTDDQLAAACVLRWLTSPPSDFVIRATDLASLYRSSAEATARGAETVLALVDLPLVDVLPAHEELRANEVRALVKWLEPVAIVAALEELHDYAESVTGSRGDDARTALRWLTGESRLDARQ